MVDLAAEMIAIGGGVYEETGGLVEGGGRRGVNQGSRLYQSRNLKASLARDSYQFTRPGEI